MIGTTKSSQLRRTQSGKNHQKDFIRKDTQIGAVLPSIFFNSMKTHRLWLSLFGQRPLGSLKHLWQNEIIFFLEHFRMKANCINTSVGNFANRSLLRHSFLTYSPS